MLLVVKDEAIVNLVGETEDVELDTQFGDLGQLFPGEHLANGVVRRVDDDGLGLGTESGSKLVKVNPPVVA